MNPPLLSLLLVLFGKLLLSISLSSLTLKPPMIHFHEDEGQRSVLKGSNGGQVLQLIDHTDP